MERRARSGASPPNAAARCSTQKASRTTTSSPPAAGPARWKPPIAARSDAGAPTIGFNITLPQEQEPNAYSTPDLTFNFHYFAMRKMHLAMRANGLVVFPGGFGTLDELFEILTLRQTGKARLIPIVLFDEAYWRAIINFDALVEARHDRRPRISASSASPKAPSKPGRFYARKASAARTAKAKRRARLARVTWMRQARRSKFRARNAPSSHATPD